jgi:hypothetical protein
MIRQRVLRIVIVVGLTLSMLAVSLTPPGFAQTGPGTTSAKLYKSIENPKLPPKPQVLPPTMPVFAIMPTLINPDILLRNAGLMNGVDATGVYSETSRGGLDHLFAFNPDNGNMVDEFNRTGGLFAVNYMRAFTETTLTIVPNTPDICLFLQNRQLFPSEIEPQYTDCRVNPPYSIKQIHLSTVEPDNGRGTNSVIGALVEVPLAINIGIGAPDYIPMGGPGGHLSLILAGNVNMPSLDSTLLGLQALASPWFGRMRNMDPIGYYPVVPMQQAIEKFKAGFPQDVPVDPGTPVMVYYVGFPDVPQDAVMPMWTFPDATAIISDTVVNLKDSAMPGVEGFAPEVSVISPVDGSVFLSDQPVSITFDISGDQGPFTYTISADSTPILSGVTEGGSITLNLGPLPLEIGREGGHDLSVQAVNQFNIPGEDTVFLGEPAVFYLPFLDHSSQGLNGAYAAGLQPNAVNPSAPDSILGVGVEWIMNYHDPAHNLSLTKADAEGFYNWLGALGWAKKFDYGNDSAWERDWRDCTLGGGDCTFGVERTQFAYFSGHGSPASFYFGIAKDYGGAWAGNARFQNVRWAAFSSCQTVRAGPYVGPGDPPLTDWFNSFQGSYMVLGFHSNMGDVPFGFSFAFNMSNPLYTLFPSLKPSISQAWVNTAFQMHAGKPAYLYAVGNLNPENYKLPPAGSGPRPALTGIYQFRWVWWDE